MNKSGFISSTIERISFLASSIFSPKYESPQIIVLTTSAWPLNAPLSALPGPTAPSLTSGLMSAFSSPPIPAKNWLI